MTHFAENENSRQLLRTKMIIHHWSPAFMSLFGGYLPNDYMCFDIETTGFSTEKDLITEWGHCLVRNRQVLRRDNFVLNWYERPDLVNPVWLDQKLATVKAHMRVEGNEYRITPEVMQSEGMDPIKVIRFFYDFMLELRQQGLLFVAHNGWGLDARMVKSHIEQDLEQPWTWGPNEIFDTGGVEKASQMNTSNVLPRPGDTLETYFKRVAAIKADGIKWRLDKHCIPKYELDKKFGLDPAKMHKAGDDAYATHLLFEALRDLYERELVDEPLPVETPVQLPGRPAAKAVTPVRTLQKPDTAVRRRGMKVR